MNLRHRSCGLARRAAFCLIAAGLLAAPAVQAAPVQRSAPLDDRDNYLFTEDFEGTFLPAGWARIQTNTFQTWSQTSDDAHTGTYCARILGHSLQQNEWLITPALDLSAAINPKLTWYERGIGWATSMGHHYIMASTTSQTNPAAFSIIADFVPGNHSIPTDFDGEPAEVSIASLAGQPVVYLAFRYYDNSATADAWLIDDVSVSTPSGHDVGAIAVTPDGGNLGYGSPITPQVTVENFGLASETFDVELAISQSGAPPVYTQSVSVSNLAPGAQSVVNLPAFTPTAGQYYDLTATTQLVGDSDASNDGATSGFTTYFEVHVPLGLLFTNSGCGPCVQANQALDAYMPTQGNQVALMRVHVSWPYGGDIMYLANIAQSQALVSEYGVSGVPDFWLDGYLNTSNLGSAIVAAFNTGKTWKSPLRMDLHWNDDTDELTTVVNITGALRPGTNYELFCSITEDQIVHNGGNGEPLHQQAFRRMWTSTTAGVPVPDTVGSHPLAVNLPLTGTWVYSNLRATVYVRDMDTGTIVQAATDFLTNIESLTGVETPVAAGFGVMANHPNPFNPKTSIDYAVNAAGPASLRIYDSAGRLVRTLVDGVLDAGSHRAVWDGTDGAGNALPSGVYLVRLQSAGQQDSHKLLLAK
jgi:hypothetical protein